MRDREGFQFDFETQRFIKNRWETELGEKVRQEIIDGITSSVDIRFILDSYVLDQEENTDPYGHPIYPKEAMKENSFWVLTQDDLRGIHIYNEDLSNSRSLGKKALSYGYFYNCDFTKSSLDRTELSYCHFEKCIFEDAYLSHSGGFNIKFIECNLTNVLMAESAFIDCDFSSSDLRKSYFGDAFFEDIKVNYLTNFDYSLSMQWDKREMLTRQVPDILRAIRIAYESAELWNEADKYLFEEKVAFRKYILWTDLVQNKSISSMSRWLESSFLGHLSGYATKPMQIIYTGVIISLGFAIAYTLQGDLSSNPYPDDLLESIYFSFTTFATLGYGDLSFSEAHPFMRILSTSEAWIGAITMALYVTVLARKVFR